MLCYNVHMSSKTTTSLHVRLPRTLKQNAEKVFKGLGLDASSAIRLFYTQSTLQQTLPFPLPKVRSVSPKTWKIIEAALADEVIGPFSNADDALRALYADD